MAGQRELRAAVGVQRREPIRRSATRTSSARGCVNEATFSYLTSRSGGGAVTHIAPRDQGVNVDVGNDGRGMSYSVSGSINLAYPGVNTQDYTSWQFKDTMTFNVGNHTLKWGTSSSGRSSSSTWR